MSFCIILLHSFDWFRGPHDFTNVLFWGPCTPCWMWRSWVIQKTPPKSASTSEVHRLLFQVEMAQRDNEHRQEAGHVQYFIVFELPTMRVNNLGLYQLPSILPHSGQSPSLLCLWINLNSDRVDRPDYLLEKVMHSRRKTMKCHPRFKKIGVQKATPQRTYSYLAGWLYRESLNY